MLKITLLLFILFTTNLFGREWKQTHFVQYEKINTLKCIDSSNCFAFANDLWQSTNRIYKSTDQGNSWNEIYAGHYPDSIETLNKCQMPDTDNVYITYWKLFVIDKSTDAGKTFRRIIFESPGRELKGAFLRFKMYNKDIGVIVADNETFFTKDGWETYTIVVHDEYKYVGRPIYFIDSNNVAASVLHFQGTDHIKLNLDTGLWSVYHQGDSVPEGEDDEDMTAVCFVNDSTGFACGGQKYQNSFADDMIWKTTDRGLNWEVIFDNRKEKSTMPMEITFVDEKHGIAVGAWGKMIETTDGGKTWEYIEEPNPGTSTSFGEGGFATIAGQNLIVTYWSNGLYIYGYPTSIQDREVSDLDVQVYQTPGQLSISITDKTIKSYSIQIVDMLGKSMYEDSLQNGFGNIVDLSGFASGMYMYRVLCENAVAKTGKIVVDK